MSLFTQYFFVAGLLAVAFFFQAGATVGFSLFVGEPAATRLMRAHSVLLALLLGATAWAVTLLWPALAEVAGGRLPDAPEIHARKREVLSVILLGIVIVFHALMGAIGWVRRGRAGNAFRTVLWAVPGVKLTTGAAVVQALLERATLAGGPEALSDEELPGAFAATLAPLREDMRLWLLAVAGLTGVSMIIALWMSAKSRESAPRA